LLDPPFAEALKTRGTTATGCGQLGQAKRCRGKGEYLSTPSSDSTSRGPHPHRRKESVAAIDESLTPGHFIENQLTALARNAGHPNDTQPRGKERGESLSPISPSAHSTFRIALIRWQAAAQIAILDDRESILRGPPENLEIDRISKAPHRLESDGVSGRQVPAT
jgi:hypothetical protein